MDQLVFLACILSLAAAGHEPKVTVKEGDDAILPCSASGKEDITNKTFDWKKLGLEKKEVYMYDKGRTYGRNSETQDPQLNGRVSHFPDELKSGNASITIRDTKVADNGNYTCIFPDLQGGSTIQLVINRTLKDRRAENIPGVSPKPSIIMGNATDGGVLLKCEVLDAYPQPTLHWQDSDGKVLKFDEPQVTEKGGRYDVTLPAIVTQTKSNHFMCVSTQEAISHTVKAEITVPDKMFEKCEAPGLSVRDVIVLGIGLFVLGCAVGAGGAVIYFKCFRKETRDQRTTNGHAVEMSHMSSEDPPDPSHQRLTRVVH